MTGVVLHVRRYRPRPERKLFPAHETREFDGSTSSRDVEPFFFRVSCTGGGFVHRGRFRAQGEQEGYSCVMQKR